MPKLKPEIPPSVVLQEERIAELAERAFSKASPEIPGDVHDERRALAKEVLKLTKRLDKAAQSTPRKPAAVDRSSYEVMRNILEALGERLDVQMKPMPGRPREARISVKPPVIDLGPLKKVLHQQLRLQVEAAKKLEAWTKRQARASVGSQRLAQRREPRVPRAEKPAPADRAPRVTLSKGCAVEGCTEKPVWKLACAGHLKALPAVLRAKVMERGARGRPPKEWPAAAAEARKVLRAWK